MAQAAVNMAGVRYGAAVAMRDVGRTPSSGRLWEFRCDCGTLFSAAGHEARRGSTTCCPACAGAKRAAVKRTHGQTESREYAAWCAMKTRCLNPNGHAFHHYGGRGISICDRWVNSFETFLADMGPKPAGATLDRYPDMNGNYEPANCRWATRAEQANNKRNNVRITVNGETKTLAQWASSAGLNESCIRDRIKRGLQGAALLERKAA
jgi:hypothetical protein